MFFCVISSGALYTISRKKIWNLHIYIYKSFHVESMYVSRYVKVVELYGYLDSWSSSLSCNGLGFFGQYWRRVPIGHRSKGYRS